MKKNWITPELEKLDISATAGGPNPSGPVDKELWQDPVDGNWKEQYGTDLS